MMNSYSEQELWMWEGKIYTTLELEQFLKGIK